MFLGSWQAQPLSDLANKIRNTMPAGNPGTLTPQQSTDLVAHILKTGSFPSGASELPSDDAALARIGWPKGLVTAAAQTGPGRVFPPLGNMAQLMRGIFFPNANLIFTVQTHDPGGEAASRRRRRSDRAAFRSSNGAPGSMADGSSWTTPPSRWPTRRR